jgi:dienelactone hydrolase
MHARLTLIVAVALVLSACGGSNVDRSPNVANSAPTATPTLAAPTAGTVNIRSADGVILVGTFLPAAQPNSPALLLLHQWQSDRHSYDDFAKRMQSKGFNVLAIDGRGFGESTKTTDGKTVQAERTPEAVQAMLGDVDAAMRFLAEQTNVDKTKIGIVGASYGSSLALIYAADHPNVAAVALLSPGLNYFGNMPTEPAISKYADRPLYIITGQQQDSESFEAEKKLNPVHGGRARYESTTHPDGGHGTALLKVGAVEELDDFFVRRLSSRGTGGN